MIEGALSLSGSSRFGHRRYKTASSKCRKRQAVVEISDAVPAGDNRGAGIDGIEERAGSAGVVAVDSDFNITRGRSDRI